MTNFRDVSDLHAAIASQGERLTGFDLVVGLPRSGMIPAALIATMHKVPLADLHTYNRGLCWPVRGHIEKLPETPIRVLMVDDTVRHGVTMKWALQSVARKDEITRFAVWEETGPNGHHDFAAGRVAGPRAFPWNIWRSRALQTAACDMDGVLCRDPTKEENDDGPHYLEFMGSVRPLYRPQYELQSIITGRREKYRAQTEGWLIRHGVRYKKLLMKFDALAHDQSKAKHIQQTGPALYIESDPRQAAKIAQQVRIPVFCTGNQRVYR